MKEIVNNGDAVVCSECRSVHIVAGIDISPLSSPVDDYFDWYDLFGWSGVFGGNGDSFVMCDDCELKWCDE